MYEEGFVQIKIPVYLSKSSHMLDIIETFQKGVTHMGIVCETPCQAHALCEIADAVHDKILTRYDSKTKRRRKQLKEDQKVGSRNQT